MSRPDTALDQLLQAAGVESIAVALLGEDERSVALELDAHAMLRPAPGDAAAVVAGATPEVTAHRLDEAALVGAPKLLLILDARGRAAAHVAAWVAAHPGWLTLDRPPAGIAVVAPAETVARSDTLPGVWRRAPAPAVPDPAADEARARRQRAQAEAQRLEIDRLHAELDTERAWVAAEVERTRASMSWRVGHRLARLARALTFRRDMGTDALAKIAERMRSPVDR